MEARTMKRHGLAQWGEEGAAQFLHGTGREAYGLGVVTDNVDPEGKGRVRVSLESACPGSESGWLPVLRRSAGSGSGMWTLPEIGTQAVYALTDAERGEGFVLGFIYDGRHRPPEGSARKAAESTLLQTRRHRIEIIDEDGKEEIRIESADGKMRAVLGKDGALKLVNELGDIRIKCRSLKAEGGEEVALCAGKSASLSTDDSLKTKAKGAIGIESEKEVKVVGKNVKMSGSKGVCAEGRQIAVEGDKVTGFDVHVMVVPAGTSTANVPLPHPFIGEMKESLSSDVKIGSKKCAVKGSKARHSDATHMQLPGTIQFQQSPKKEGEVTGGTSGKVKIDGKEAAVIGSTVTTCNDVGARDNSTIVAVGASMPMPKIINPLNAEEFRREREEEEGKKPSFQNVKWTKTSADESEEVELSAGVRDMADGNAVTLQVFPEGRGPEDGAAYARLPATVKDGAASARWSYRADRREVPPEENPRFVFTAHSAWCNFAKSSNSLEVKLKRPEITRAEWRDADGNTAGKGLVGEGLMLHAETRDIEDGQGATLTVRDAATGEEVFQTGAEVRDGIAEAEWKPIDTRQPDDTRELKYTFEATSNRCKKAKSGECRVRNPRVVSMEWDKKAVYYGDKATLKIKTFELSDESPVCKLQLWEKDYTTEDDFILDQDITIDSDEVEQEIEFDFKLPVNAELESIIIPMLIYNGNILEAGDSKRSEILVGTGFINSTRRKEK